jgi:hypothetical protein
MSVKLALLFLPIAALSQSILASAILGPMKETNEIFPLGFRCVLADAKGRWVGEIVGQSDPNKNPLAGNEGVRVSWKSNSTKFPSPTNAYFFPDGEVFPIDSGDKRYFFTFRVADLPGVETGFVAVQEYRPDLSSAQLKRGIRPKEYVAAGICKFAILELKQ